MTTKRICDGWSANPNNNPHEKGLAVAEFSVMFRETVDGYMAPSSVNKDYCRDCFRELLEYWRTGGYSSGTEVTINRD